MVAGFWALFVSFFFYSKLAVVCVEFGSYIAFFETLTETRTRSPFTPLNPAKPRTPGGPYKNGKQERIDEISSAAIYLN